MNFFLEIVCVGALHHVLVHMYLHGLSTWQYPCRSKFHSLWCCPDNHRSVQEHYIQIAWAHWVDNIFLPAPKSSLIHETTTTWHRSDWWDLLPFLCLHQWTVASYHIPSICWNNSKLHHDVPSDKATIRPKLQWLPCHLLDNHHCSLGQGANSTLKCFPLKHYKIPPEEESRCARSEGSLIYSSF